VNGFTENAEAIFYFQRRFTETMGTVHKVVHMDITMMFIPWRHHQVV